jgi:hypothetical protein
LAEEEVPAAAGEEEVPAAAVALVVLEEAASAVGAAAEAGKDMYRRDLILAEIQKLAQVLARIVGLKLEGKTTEAEELFAESLQKDFEISLEDLLSNDTEAFETSLLLDSYTAEKLEMLSQFIYEQFRTPAEDIQKQAFAEKLLMIYRVLESKYHIVSMTNLDRQKNVLQYLNT